MLIASALLALSLHSACVAPAAAPTLTVERAAWIRGAHAALVHEDAGTKLRWTLKAAFPALEARRTVTVEAFSADGKRLFTRSAVARPGASDSRYHRTVTARVALDLPDLSGVAEFASTRAADRSLERTGAGARDVARSRSLVPADRAGQKSNCSRSVRRTRASSSAASPPGLVTYCTSGFTMSHGRACHL